MAIDIEKICRACLGLHGPLLSIYDGDGSGGGCIADMLGHFTKVMPRQDDKLPEVVCLACISEINQCYSFKLKCENSYRTLCQLVPDALLEEASEPQKVRILQYNKSVQTPPEFTSQLTKVTLETEKYHKEVQTTPLIFEGSKSQRLDKIKLEKNLDEAIAEEIHTTETTVAENIQALTLKDFDLSDNEADEIIMKYEAGDEEFYEIVPEIATYLADNAAQREESTENTSTLNKFTTQQQSENNLLVNTCIGDNKTRLHLSNTEIVRKNATPQSIKATTKPTKLPHYCERCGAGFALYSSLARHAKQDICNKGNFKCNKCDRTFISLETLNEHTATHLVDHWCTESGLSLETSNELGQHMIKVHGRNPRTQCPICRKGFALKSSLRDHICLHTGEKPFTCTICQRSFKQEQFLKIHLMRHSKEKNFKCPDCEKCFVTKSELCTHRRRHTGERPFHCDECQATFSLSSSLITHKRRHAGERPYACDFCPKRFVSSSELTCHRRVHTRERPYKCRWCSKSFRFRQNLMKHHRIHTGERNYGCFCGEKFTHSGKLRAHITKIHDGVVSGHKVGGRADVKLRSSTRMKNLQRRDSDKDNDDKIEEEAEAGHDVIYIQKATIVKVECEEDVTGGKLMQNEENPENWEKLER